MQSEAADIAPLPLAGGYLANLSPSQLAGAGGCDRLEAQLPATISGADFLESFGTHYDSVTKVDPQQT